MQARVGAQFLDVVRTLLSRLRDDPTEFGEPLYHLPVLRLQVRTGLLAPLVVHYGVHETQWFVFVRGVQVLSGHF
ncbi:MAG TPA: hypothetical protein VIL46_07025 [Gemmataceae bacterium]